MSAIRDNLNTIIISSPSSVPEVCDGDAWSFKACDGNGKQVFKWKLSHIYGIDPFENIGRILDSYIPEYEKPVYKEEEIEELIVEYPFEKGEV